MMTRNKTNHFFGRYGMGVVSRDLTPFQSALIFTPEEGKVRVTGSAVKHSLKELAELPRFATALRGYDDFLKQLPFPKEILPPIRVFVVKAGSEAELDVEFSNGELPSVASLCIILEKGAVMKLKGVIQEDRLATTLLFAHIFLAPESKVVCTGDFSSGRFGAGVFFSADVSEGASVDCASLGMSESFLVYRQRARLLGKDASCTDTNIIIGKGNGVIDALQNAEHKAEATISHIFSRSALTGEAKGVLQSRIGVERGACESEGTEDMKSLLMSDEAEADLIPHLGIEENETQCYHSASISRLRDEALYACALRGISEEEARKMLSEGFFEEVLSKISASAQPILRSRVIEMLSTIV